MCAAGLASCATLGLGKPKTDNTPETVVETETRTVYETEYLPGRTVLQPYPEIPEKFPRDVPYLSDEYLTGDSDDLEGRQAVGVGVNWAEQYHDLGKLYIGLINWIQGINDGQVETQKALDAENPGAPGVPSTEEEK